MLESLVDAYECDRTVIYMCISLAVQEITSMYSILTLEWWTPDNSASQFWALLKIPS